MKIEFLPRAEADLIRQFRYYLVVQEAPMTAMRFREAVIESVKQLQPHPRIGNAIPRFDPRPSVLARQGIRDDPYLLL